MSCWIINQTNVSEALQLFTFQLIITGAVILHTRKPLGPKTTAGVSTYRTRSGPAETNMSEV